MVIQLPSPPLTLKVCSLPTAIWNRGVNVFFKIVMRKFFMIMILKYDLEFVEIKNQQSTQPYQKTTRRQMNKNKILGNIYRR